MSKEFIFKNNAKSVSKFANSWTYFVKYNSSILKYIYGKRNENCSLCFIYKILYMCLYSLSCVAYVAVLTCVLCVAGWSSASTVCVAGAAYGVWLVWHVHRVWLASCVYSLCGWCGVPCVAGVAFRVWRARCTECGVCVVHQVTWPRKLRNS